MMSPVIMGATAEGRDPEPGTTIFNGGLDVYGTFACADGQWITVGALEPKFQAALAAGTEVSVLGREELAAAFARKPRAYWVERLRDAAFEVLAWG